MSCARPLEAQTLMEQLHFSCTQLVVSRNAETPGLTAIWSHLIGPGSYISSWKECFSMRSQCPKQLAAMCGALEQLFYVAQVLRETSRLSEYVISWPNLPPAAFCLSLEKFIDLKVPRST